MIREEYNTELFRRIDEEKQERILEVAGSEFAMEGFSRANTNKIAEKIGISVGSLYKYFRTKENLFLATIRKGRDELEKVLNDVAAIDGRLVEKIDMLIGIIQDYSRNHPQITKLYNELTTEGNVELARKLSMELEAPAAIFYRRLIADAQSSGEIKNDTAPEILSFYMDNLFLTLQFSYASTYYQERMRVFLGDRYAEKDGMVRSSMLFFIRSALGA
jgi:TetR/AcrR family transcriptional regulator